MSQQGISPAFENIIADHHERIENSTIEGVIDQDAFHMQNQTNIETIRHSYPEQAGYFSLRNIYDTRGRNGLLNEERIKRIFSATKGGQGQGYDWSDESEGVVEKAKDRFNAAIRGSYAQLYNKLMVDGDKIYEDLYNTAWHVFGSYVKEKGNQDEALKATLSLLFGDTITEKNGGVEFPNGVGLFHDREEMNKRGVTLSMLEEYKINAYYHIYNKHGADLMFEPHLDMDKNWHIVAQEMLEGGGNVWWTVINDIETDGYRVVMVGQHGDDKEQAASRMYGDPFSKTSSIRILADAYYDDGSGPQPIRLTKTEFFDSIAEAKAASHAYSHLDFWDNLHFLFNYKHTPKDYPDTPISPSLDTERPGVLGDLTTRLENVGFMTPGPDMSRRRVKYYMEKKGPGTDWYKSTAKAYSIGDSGFGLDFTNPGRVEIDMFWKPLWEDIQAYERAQETTGEEISQKELYNLARQRYRGMFTGRSDYGLKRMFSMYDRYFMANGPKFDPTWRFLKPENDRYLGNTRVQRP